MTKGYCMCGEIMDEVDFIVYKMCETCYRKSKAKPIKHAQLIVKRGNTDFYYSCNTLEWNYYLNRYYPKATLTMEVEHLNNGFEIKTDLL